MCVYAVRVHVMAVMMWLSDFLSFLLRVLVRVFVYVAGCDFMQVADAVGHIYRYIIYIYIVFVCVCVLSLA